MGRCRQTVRLHHDNRGCVHSPNHSLTQHDDLIHTQQARSPPCVNRLIFKIECYEKVQVSVAHSVTRRTSRSGASMPKHQQQPHLWFINRQQIDSAPSGLVSPQGCIMLQPIAGAVLMHRDPAAIRLRVAAGQSSLNIVAHCQQLPR